MPQARAPLGVAAADLQLNLLTHHVTVRPFPLQASVCLPVKWADPSQSVFLVCSVCGGSGMEGPVGHTFKNWGKSAEREAAGPLRGTWGDPNLCSSPELANLPFTEE